MDLYKRQLLDGASFVPAPVALSSAESEYNAAAHGVTGALHMRQLYQTLRGRDPDEPLTMPMFIDSSSAIAMSRNSRDTRQTRHIRRRYHYVRYAVANGDATPYKIPGELNPADVGTKNLSAATLSVLRPMMHVDVLP